MTPLLELDASPPLFALRRNSMFNRTSQPQVHAVDQVSLTVAQAKPRLVGESGCGKVDPGAADHPAARCQRRHIWFDRAKSPTSPPASSPATAAHNIQMVFQDAGESITPLHRGRRHRDRCAACSPARRRTARRVEEAATRCGLPVELLGRFPTALGASAPASALPAPSHPPRLLVLDEPTAALVSRCR